MFNSCCRTLSIGLMAAMLLSLASAAEAGEKGKWRGLAVLVTTKYESAEVGDSKGHVVDFLTQDGAIHSAAPGGFLDRARYQVVWSSDSSKSSSGYKVFTAADGSQVFAYGVVTYYEAPDWKGTWEFTGGTGKYKGIRGKGTFQGKDLSDKASYDILEGEYEIP